MIGVLAAASVEYRPEFDATDLWKSDQLLECSFMAVPAGLHSPQR